MVNDVDPARLRRLAGLRTNGARVLTIYLDLDPANFATADARKSEATSAVDAAARMAEALGLEHDARVAVRGDLERAREALAPENLDAKGAQAVALFACGPADLFEVVKLPRPVATQVTIDSSPWVAPLVRGGPEPHVAVALVDRTHLRLFHGRASELVELDPDEEAELRDEAPHRSPTDDEVAVHFDRAATALLTMLKTRGYDVLVLDVRQELRGRFEAALHPYVRDRVAGHVEVDIGSAALDEVRRETAAVCAQLRERRVGEALARLKERLGRGGRAAAGLGDVLTALNERRVETLLYEDGRALPGVVCPSDGWLGTDTSECPIDGTPVEQRPDVLENASETAVLQDAEVLVLDANDHPDLGPHGGIAAILRF